MMVSSAGEADSEKSARRTVSVTEAVWEPLDQNVSEALRAIDLVAVLFTQIRRECEFPGYS